MLCVTRGVKTKQNKTWFEAPHAVGTAEVTLLTTTHPVSAGQSLEENSMITHIVQNVTTFYTFN